MKRDNITHCEAWRAAKTLFTYCNGRMCRACIFAEKEQGMTKEYYKCHFKNIIPANMGDDITTALLMAKDNIDILRSKGGGE